MNTAFEVLQDSDAYAVVGEIFTDRKRERIFASADRAFKMVNEFAVGADKRTEEEYRTHEWERYCELILIPKLMTELRLYHDIDLPRAEAEDLAAAHIREESAEWLAEAAPFIGDDA